MKHLLYTIIIISLIAPTLAAQTDQPQWSAVMAGETLCDPVLHGEYLYTLSSDHALNCINHTGSFVWRRNIERTTKPVLSISNSGILVVADSTGMLQAVSSQGIYLWSLKLSEPVLYPPYCTADGRICALTQSNLYCLSIKGKIKWKIDLSASPAGQVCETGAASLLLTLTNHEFLTVSLTGELLSTYSLKKEITALAAAPGGYIMATGDGTLTYYRSGINAGQTGQQSAGAQTSNGFAAWQTYEAAPLFMKTISEELICVYADGSVSARDVQTNTIRWSAKLNTHIALPLYCIKTDGEYYLSCKGYAAIISSTGTVTREKNLSASAFLPLITPNGILIAMEDWVINSWQFDTKILKETPRGQNAAELQYRILKMQAQSQSLPFFVPNGDTQALLTHIATAIDEGTVGTQEAAYAFTLHTILANAQKAVYFPSYFTVYEQAQAAELLGKLESLEYRGLLLDEAQKTDDPTLAVAIIRALGFVGADPDGKSIEHIQLLLRRCGIREQEPAAAACESLGEIAKYGDKTAADAAIKALFSIAAGAYTENIRQYARQKIKTIVE